MVVSRFYPRKGKDDDVVILTACSMTLGLPMLLGATALTQNIINVSFNTWIIILWLSAINTALSFVLWNHALKTLKVYEQPIL